MDINIPKILTKALKEEERNLFHSEADFQFHLAWKIQQMHKDADVRLELPISKTNTTKWEYCDIVVNGTETVGVELKYKTKKLTETISGELFELKQQAAQNLGRYDFLKDVSRLECWCKENKLDIGYAILLTNDSSYWKEPRGTNKSVNFSLHARTINGELAWSGNPAPNGIKGRDKPIVLKSTYILNWFDIPAREGFRYLLVKVEC
jgi:hypothetical protein